MYRFRPARRQFRQGARESRTMDQEAGGRIDRVFVARWLALLGRCIVLSLPCAIGARRVRPVVLRARCAPMVVVVCCRIGWNRLGQRPSSHNPSQLPGQVFDWFWGHAVGNGLRNRPRHGALAGPDPDCVPLALPEGSKHNQGDCVPLAFPEGSKHNHGDYVPLALPDGSKPTPKTDRPTSIPKPGGAPSFGSQCVKVPAALTSI